MPSVINSELHVNTIVLTPLEVESVLKTLTVGKASDFRCGALLFMVIHVIYKYKNR